METTNRLGGLILLFIGVIVCLTLLQGAAEPVGEMTNKYVVTAEFFNLTATTDSWDGENINESTQYTVANPPTGWKINACPLTSFTFGNSSENYTITNDYLVTLSTGNFTIVNSTITVDGGNHTYVGYHYCADGYITDSAGRTVAKLILIFAALGIAAYAIFIGAKEYL